MKVISALAIGACVVCGCVPVLVGAGILTGYALGNDSASGNIKTEYRALWDEALFTLQDMEAEIVNRNESKGVLKARILEYDVTVAINTITPEMQRLKVSARKLLLPKPQFAQKVFFNIIEDLE
ncbi:MAG: hypothetical protein GF333_00860 [Candidatus Omnitrophica bacterium]|nr:hypothetical protein [Candidatus Omnitrophota bacterium]